MYRPATPTDTAALRGAMLHNPTPSSPTVPIGLPALLVALMGLPGFAVAQQTPSDLDKLAAAVGKAHRSGEGESEAGIDGFDANLRIQNVAQQSKQRVEVELRVKFFEWPDERRAPRTVPLIRYQQIDAAQKLEFGRDRNTYWANIDNVSEYMTRKELEADKESVKRNLKLARQMIRFLEPEDVIRSMQQPTAVRTARLQIGRLVNEECRTVAGRLDRFPLRQAEGDDRPVQIELFVDSDDRLIGLQATPMDDDGKPTTQLGEFLLFADHRQQNGRLIPMRVRHYAVDPQGRRQQQLIVDITTLDLAPTLTVADFDKPK